MKLKGLVIALSMLGWVTAHAENATVVAPRKPVNIEKKQFKGMEVSACEMCPVNEWYTYTMESMSQNLGRAKPTVCCHRPIAFAGGINVDYHTGNLSQGYMGENNERLSVNDGYVNVFGNVTEWVKAFASLSYNNVSDTSIDGFNGSTNGVRYFELYGQYSDVYPVNSVDLEQAYITLANFAVSPFFIQVGKQFQDYGRYRIHPITRSMTQVLTETLRTSAEIGFLTRMGLNGQLFAFDDPLRKLSKPHSEYVYGAALGWDHPCDQIGYDLGIAYMSNMTGINDVAFAVNAYRFTTDAVGGTDVFTDSVGSMAVYGDINTGPFSFGARYASALSRFNAADLATAIDGSHGAKPRSLDLTAGFAYNYWCKNQMLYVGYQKGYEVMALALPSSRWLAGLTVSVFKNADVTLELAHDEAYSVAKGGTGENSNTVAMRGAVKFG